jgi:ATP-dependent Clp protease ATP-binding subunit ClpC
LQYNQHEREMRVTSVTEDYTPRGRRTLRLAGEEARRFCHEFIGTEHLLLGIMKAGESIATRALKNLGLEATRITSAVEKLMQAGPEAVAPGEVPLTPRARSARDHAREEAEALDHRFVGPEHLLLGLLKEKEGVAAKVLGELGVNYENAHEEILRVIKG